MKRYAFSLLILLQTAAFAAPQVPVGVASGLASGQSQDLIVEFDDSAVEKEVSDLKAGAHLERDNDAILALREKRYDDIKRQVDAALPATESETLIRYSHLPMTYMRVRTAAALDALSKNARVKAIYRNMSFHPVLGQDLALINQPAVAAAGEIGTGSTTVVIDTGVNYTLPDFGSCTSPGVPASCKVSFYQNIADASTSLDSNGHGTNVSGIVVGVASGSHIAAVNVFGAGASTSTSLIISGINWAISNRAAYNITGINLSIGDGVNNMVPCGNSMINPFVTPVSNAKAAGIITVAASGNNAYTSGVNGPACTPGVVSVGAVYDSNVGGLAYTVCTDAATAADQVACFSNSASFLTLLAPGAMITAAGYTMTGTSQASPHVAGAVAVLRSAYPLETADQTISRLTASGTPVTDPRNGIVTPRLNLLAAATPLNDMFANRFAISGNSGSIAGINVLATKEAGEPLHAGNAGGKSVWWKWVAPASGQVSLDTHGSGFDTLLAVYTGTGVSSLSSVASNHNDGSPNNNSGLLFQAQANAEYEIAVDGFNGASGNITLNWGLNVSASADLAASIGGSVALGGKSIIYTATVRNNGPQSATNTMLSIALDPNLVPVSAPGCTVSGSTLSCSVGTLASGASWSVQVTASAASTGKFVTTASASSNVPDPNAANNSASSSITVAALTANDTDVPMLPPWGIAGMASLLVFLGARFSRT